MGEIIKILESKKTVTMATLTMITGMVLAGCGRAPEVKANETMVAENTQPKVTEILTETMTPTSTMTATPESTLMPTLDLAEVKIPERGYIEKMSVDEPIYALTIDDGYRKGNMEQMLTILEENNVQATFFIIGAAAEWDLGPELLKRAVADGDEIGYHTMNHDQEAIKTWTEADWINDYEQWTEMMKKYLGEDLYAKGVKKYARAPGGLFDKAFLAMTKKEGLIAFGWDADPAYWDSGVKPQNGDILLMHVDVADVDNLEKEIKLTNIKPVTISKLVEVSLSYAGQ